MTSRQTDGRITAAAKASISTTTAYRYEQQHQLPSSYKQPRGRRRPDPLVDFFDAEVVPMLKAAPGLRAVAIFEECSGVIRACRQARTSNARAPHPILARDARCRPGGDLPSGS